MIPVVTPNSQWADRRVSEAMTRKVVSVSVNSTMSEAADLLCEHRISGAPVIDEQGRCVGVLSGTDFIHCKAAELDGSNIRQMLSATHPYGLYTIDEVRQDLVRRHMTSAVQTISEDCSLQQAARCLCQEHIHRLIVIDDECRPVGVLTSMDLVAAAFSAQHE